MGEGFQVTGWGIALLVGIGGALMFAPTYWGRLAACLLFAVAGVLGTRGDLYMEPTHGEVDR